MNDPSETPPPPDPIVAAQLKSRVELPARFYKDVSVEPTGDGFAILLDNRPVRTPARNPLVAPTSGIAECLAAEWDAQVERIDPRAMPLTCLMNSAIDGVADKIDDVLSEIATYAGTDLVCYRADAPEGLVAQQALHWDPVVDWLRETHGIRLVLTQGISHVAQSDRALDLIRGLIGERSVASAAALSTITTLTGSAGLALALDAGVLDADAVWHAAHVDEDWQISLWGEDAEAMARRTFRRAEFDAAALVLGELSS